MLVWGGAFGSTALGDGRAYDPFANVWAGISTSGTPGPSPGPRTGHTLVWTGTEAVVWGGDGAVGGSSYNPATDSWTALPEAGGPSHVYWHTAVWTGSVMMVWGGETPGGAVNTGAYWNAGGWTSMDPTNAPSARRRHSAVWAGQSIGMIVWGGDVGGVTVFNDGGTYFYRPLFGDNWATPPSPVALGPRVYHTATWTGTRMVVFGGADTSHIWGDGAAFNPLTNTWALVGGVNAPTPRYRHTAVCPGDDSVIVWGGSAGTSFADGARYFPATNTWTPIAPSGLAGRRQLEATWSGREMLVWGGLGDFGALFADGARYNPAFDGWTSMSTLGAPSARYDHRARQAGDEMLVWGGSSNTDSGGRYCASCAVLTGFEAAKNLAFSNNTTLTWSASAGVTAYTLYHGTFDGTAPLTNHTCFQTGLGAPTASDPTVPPAGTGWYYLVGASNSCSRTGLGSMTGGAPRPIPACPQEP